MTVLPLLFALATAAELKTATGTIHGTLLAPEGSKPVPVVLIIAGSGPTDRDGNNPLLPGKNDSLKLLAEGLAAKGIASLRYDKRGIGESRSAMTAEKDLRFDTYVDDAAAWAAQLKRDPRFTRLVIAGHSEGALIGTIAAQRGSASGLVSIAGTARPADVLLRDQLAGKLPPELQAFNDTALAALKSGKTVDDVPLPLMALYRPSVQPYLISWFRYDPAAELRKLTIPVLIVQGTTDMQVSVDDARALAKAKPDAKLLIVDGMSHLPVDQRVTDAIAAFVKAESRGQKAEGRGSF